MLGKDYQENRLSKISNKVRELVSKHNVIEDDDAIITIISPLRTEVKPKKMTLEECQIEFIKRMDTEKYRKFYNSFNIWIDYEKGVVVLSK